MTVTAGRPLVPTDRESTLGRRPDTVDLSQQPVDVRQEAAAAPPRQSFLRRRIEYVRSLDPRKVEGPLLPLLASAVLAAVGGSLAPLYRDGSALVQPDIQADLGIDLINLLALIGLTATPFALGRVYFGYLADRLNRVWLIRLGALLAVLAFGLMSSATSTWMLGIGMVLLGAGESIHQPSGHALLTDYYPVQQRIRVVFLLFQFSAIATALAYPLSSVVAKYAGWRVLYLGFMGLAVVALLLYTRIREVPRGYWERRALGAAEDVAVEEQPALSWAECWKTAWSISYLRVQCLAAPFLGIVSAMIQTLLAIYFAREFGLDVGQRGLLLSITGIAGMFGLLVVSPMVSRLVGERPRTIVSIQAGQAIFTAALLSTLNLIDSLPVAVGIFSVQAMIATTVFPLQFSVTSLVVPPRMRAFGLQTLFSASVPATWILTLLGLNTIANRGFGAVFVLLTIASLIGGVILLAALPGVERDIRNGQLAALAGDEVRRNRESGRNDLLLVRRLDVAYGGTQVLFGVDLDVAAGEIVALLGTNGAGKSTLLRAIAGAQPPIGGVIYLDGRDITHTPPHETARAGVVVVPGGQGVCPTLSVRENLRIAAWLHRDDDAYVQERLDLALELFPRLRERLDADAGTLSGGEQQMLALAQSYLMEPRLLMIDELSLGLAPQVVEQLLDSLRAINAAGTTILLVEQSINVALTIARRAVFMEKGEVRFDGSTEELLGRPDLVRAIFMGGAATAGRTRRRTLRTAATAEQLLDVQDITVSFGGITALNGVSLAVSPREIVGIIGPNGAGKTTLFDVISGLVRPDAGTVLIKGNDVSRLGLDARSAAGLGRSFQNARLFPSMTVRENLTVAMQRHIKARNPMLAALWAPNVRAAERSARERVDDIIDLLGLQAFADKFVGELSTGGRRAVDVGCVMLSGPDLLLLDEPSSGLAQAETEALGPVIHRIVRETGCGVLLIEHDMPLVTSVADRIIAMELGRVVTTGPAQDVLNHPDVQRAYLSASREVLLRSDSRLGEALAAAGMLPVDDTTPA